MCNMSTVVQFSNTALPEPESASCNSSEPVDVILSSTPTTTPTPNIQSWPPPVNNAMWKSAGAPPNIQTLHTAQRIMEQRLLLQDRSKWYVNVFVYHVLLFAT